MITKQHFNDLYDYYKFIREEGEFLTEDTPSKYNKPGYYIKPLKFFITVDKMYLRRNHIANLKRIFGSPYCELQKHHIDWILHMHAFTRDQMNSLTKHKILT